MGKRVLMLYAGYCEEAMIKALKGLGCYVITTGNRPEQKGHLLADEYVYGDFSDKELMLKIAIEKKVDAVCPCVSDFGVKTAAYISEKLGFKGQDSYEATCIINDKDRFKQFAKELGGINTPLATPFDNKERAIAWAGEADIEFPMIVKPVDLSSGNGVMRVDSRQELINAIENAFMKSRAKRILVEPFIVGTQHGFCTFLINRKVVAFCSNDERSFVNPYRVEVDLFPASDIHIVQEDLIQQIERMANALQLQDGIFHLQYIYKEGKAYIIECMRRVLGNLYMIPASSAMGGFNWDYWHVRATCGFGCLDFPYGMKQTGYWAYRALFSKRNGVYSSIVVPDDMREYLYSTYMLHEPGYEITQHVFDPAGILFFHFGSKEEMEKVMIERYSDIGVLLE